MCASPVSPVRSTGSFCCTHAHAASISLNASAVWQKGVACFACLEAAEQSAGMAGKTSRPMWRAVESMWIRGFSEVTQSAMESGGSENEAAAARAQAARASVEGRQRKRTSMNSLQAISRSWRTKCYNKKMRSSKEN